MNILIASAVQETCRELGRTLGALLPRATYFHAGSAERALEQFSRYRIDIALVDLQLLCPDPAAYKLLRLTFSPRMVFNKVAEQMQSSVQLPAAGRLLTFDGAELDATVDMLPQYLGTKLGETPLVLDAHRPTIWATSNNGEVQDLEVRNVAWAYAESGKVMITDVDTEVHTVRERLKDLEQRLESCQFQRIHKSYLVNLDLVAGTFPCTSGGLVLEMMDKEKTRLPVSRRYATKLRKRTGWKSGWRREAEVASV